MTTALTPTALARLRERIAELLPKVAPEPWTWVFDSLVAKKGKKKISIIKVLEGFEWDEYSSEPASIEVTDDHRALIALAPTMAAAILARLDPAGGK